jgi:hypothetical protein
MITSKKIISKLALLIVAVATLALSGCSAILGGIGALSDASTPERNIPAWQEATIKPGTAINVVLKDGTWLRGKYSGLGRIPAEQYAAIYSQAREQKPEGIFLPALGDSIDIGTSVRLFKEFEEKLEGTFEGFEHDRILTKLKGTTLLSDVPLSFITKISSDRGHAIFGETIKRLILEGQIPVMSAIVVEGEAGKTRVAMDNVRQIEIPVKKHSALTGFLIGAVIDTAVVIAVISALSDLSFNLWGE